MKKSIGSWTRETMRHADGLSRRADKFFAHARHLFEELIVWEEEEINAEGNALIAQISREMKRRAENEIIAGALRELVAR